MTVKNEAVDRIVIRFAGDSGDGMQLTGDRFTESSAIFGNDLSTFPNYPAEIRAPAGTIAGVSAFQVHIADHDILTPGDAPNVLVAMNPAALKANISDLDRGGMLIVNSDAFDERALGKAGYASNPLTDDSLKSFRVYEIPMTTLTLEATKPTGAKPRDAERSKNFFALGLITWMFSRPYEDTLEWINKKYANRQMVLESNLAAYKAGHSFGETAELFGSSYSVEPAHFDKGVYTNITGNHATALGIVAAGLLSDMEVLLGTYPITPASDILHELSKLRHYNVMTFQAEDEIAGVGAALGASYGGSLGVTTTSGPGVDLKAETVGLAVSLELPLLLIDVQRAGPSTGLPTKTEQGDLLLAMYGRHGESPVPIVAASTPSDCFNAVIDAARIAIKYRTPVILLTDGYLANGSEPWLLPNIDELNRIEPNFKTEANHTNPDGSTSFYPYVRDPKTLIRDMAIPGTPGLEHRIGGLEKSNESGSVSYDSLNHELMVTLRSQKIEGIQDDIAHAVVDDPGNDADVLLLGWGSTYGAIAAGARRLRALGKKVAHLHLRHLNPFPANLGDVLKNYETIVIPEINLGQLSKLIRAKYLIEVNSFTKVQGVPFKAAEIEKYVLNMIKENQ